MLILVNSVKLYHSVHLTTHECHEYVAGYWLLGRSRRRRIRRYDAVMAQGYKGRWFANRQPPRGKVVEFEAVRLLVEENPDISEEQLREDSKELRRAIQRVHAQEKIKIEVVSPFSLGDIVLPEKHVDLENPEWSEHDLLTVEGIQEICQQIMNDYVNTPMAASGVGIPAQTAVEYLDTGRADLAAGLPTRKAVFAKFTDAAVNALVRELLKKIVTAKMGFQNFSFILERCFPEHFSDKRVSKKETKVNSQLEALQRQLSGAMTPDSRKLGPGPK